MKKDTVHDQYNLIHGTDWDILVILDACRYDYFNKTYRKFMDGNLKKTRTRGSWTFEWLENTWDKVYRDINYVSGNPYMLESREISELKFPAQDKFNDVFDVWDEEFGTALPSSIAEKAISVHNSSEKKTVAHFMQPHEPYIFLKLNFRSRIQMILKNAIESNLSSLLIYLKEIVGIKDRNSLQRLDYKLGKKNTLKLYEINLKLALNRIKEIEESTSGKIVITSDHGEFLGENGIYRHPRPSEMTFWKKFKDSKFLRVVPWLEVSS